jgi:ParD-like antitoxin of type II ParDE toxin-antitoxin system
MASPMRLDNVLVQEAETVAERNKRSVPKQIEYWAELGRAVERVLNPTDVLAVTQGLAEIQLIVPKSARVAPDDVFAALEHDRAHSQLASKVTRAVLSYEASTAKPGLLDRVQNNGQRDTGRFVDGEFQIVPG